LPNNQRLIVQMMAESRYRTNILEFQAKTDQLSEAPYQKRFDESSKMVRCPVARIKLLLKWNRLLFQILLV